jgi:hypothetical protein
MLRLAREAAWAPLGVFVLFGLGLATGATQEFFWVLHALGGGAAAFFVYRVTVLFPAGLGRPSALGRFLLAFGTACMAALAWEFGEFMLDRLRGTHLQVDLADTMIDLMLAVLGAFLALMVVRTLPEEVP